MAAPAQSTIFGHLRGYGLIKSRHSFILAQKERRGSRLIYTAIVSILLAISGMAPSQSSLSSAEMEAIDLIYDYLILEKSTEIRDICLRTNNHKIFDDRRLRLNSVLERLSWKFPNALEAVYNGLDDIHWVCSVDKSSVNSVQLKNVAEHALVKMETFAEGQ